MRAKDVMSMEVVTIDAKATLLEAVTLLINSQESALPVLDDGNSLVGIVSEFDLIRHIMGSDAGKLANFQSQLEKGGDLDDCLLPCPEGARDDHHDRARDHRAGR